MRLLVPSKACNVTQEPENAAREQPINRNSPLTLATPTSLNAAVIGDDCRTSQAMTRLKGRSGVGPVWLPHLSRACTQKVGSASPLLSLAAVTADGPGFATRSSSCSLCT